jgi:3-hydroxyacyl-CoA dehydrogenase/3a,7a,12a-trihydroxy-5b-cholest-24-enoyl-CoA hydratase
MTEPLRFDNKVVVITGGGSGLGREYAIEFAKRGAKIVLNDFGGSVTGVGNSNRSADLTVKELKSLGAEAVANYDSVCEGEKIIQTAIKTFGRVDVVINNAGILKEVWFHKMKPEEWEQVISVHLNGSFSVCKAAWKFMKMQKYGRIINTTSGTGLYGNVGQGNYTTAKLAIHGLTQTLAREGEKDNILVNSIAPMAASRLTQGTFSPELVELLLPEKITPLVVFLAHQACKTTGGLYEVAGGWITRLRWQRAEGYFFHGINVPEQVRKKWKKITTFDKMADYPNSLIDTLGKAMKFLADKPKI